MYRITGRNPHLIETKPPGLHLGIFAHTPETSSGDVHCIWVRERPRCHSEANYKMVAQTLLPRPSQTTRNRVPRGLCSIFPSLFLASLPSIVFVVAVPSRSRALINPRHGSLRLEMAVMFSHATLRCLRRRIIHDIILPDSEPIGPVDLWNEADRRG